MNFNTSDYFNPIKYILSNIVTLKDSSTFKLLYDSLPSGISGIFRVYIASVLLQTHISALVLFASGLIVYSVYLLDRTIGSEEDKVNRSSIQSSNKIVGYSVVIISFLIGSYIFALNKMLWIAFVPFLIGYLYNKELKIKGHIFKLKGGLGIKNLVVGLTWGVFITGASTGGLIIPALFLYFGFKAFMNSAICDFKDIAGDSLAGLKTFPVFFGEVKARNLLLSLHFLAHSLLLAAMLHGIIVYNPIIFLGSFLCGLYCIWNYSIAQLPIPRFLRDGESFTITALLTAESIIH